MAWRAEVIDPQPGGPWSVPWMTLGRSHDFATSIREFLALETQQRTAESFDREVEKGTIELQKVDLKSDPTND